MARADDLVGRDNHVSCSLGLDCCPLRKRVRAALKPFGLYETDRLGNYWCEQGQQKFSVNVDFGGRNAQLRYSVAFPEFKDVHHLSQFRFERALGFGLGDWDYIIEENVEDAFLLFGELIRYCFELPGRIRTATKQQRR